MELNDTDIRILKAGYARYFRGEIVSKEVVKEEAGLEPGEIDASIARLSKEDLIEPMFGGDYDLTSDGALVLEESGLAPGALVELNASIRRGLLEFLSELPPEDFGAHPDSWAEQSEFDQKLCHMNRELLHEAGYIDQDGGYVDITDSGRQYLTELKYMATPATVLFLEYYRHFRVAYRDRLNEYHSALLESCKNHPGLLPHHLLTKIRLNVLWANRMWVYVQGGRTDQPEDVEVEVVEWQGDESVSLQKFRDMPWSARDPFIREKLGIADQLCLDVSNWTIPAPEQIEMTAAEEATHEADRHIAAAKREMTSPSSDQADPPELSPYLESFRRDHPDPTKAAFIMMAFSDTPAHENIVRAVKDTLAKQGIIGLRADDKEYSDELGPNVRTYMHGCAFGVAVFDRVVKDEFNPNVSLEVGYMMALRKPVCLLKDRTLKALPTDLVGKLYRQFDTQKPMDSIPDPLLKWMGDRAPSLRVETQFRSPLLVSPVSDAERSPVEAQVEITLLNKEPTYGYFRHDDGDTHFHLFFRATNNSSRTLEVRSAELRRSSGERVEISHELYHYESYDKVTEFVLKSGEYIRLGTQGKVPGLLSESDLPLTLVLFDTEGEELARREIPLPDRERSKAEKMVDRVVASEDDSKAVEKAIEDANESTSREDALNILESWLANRPLGSNTQVIHFAQVDAELELSPGTASKYLEEAASRYPYRTRRKSSSTILFEEDKDHGSGGTLFGGIREMKF